MMKSPQPQYSVQWMVFHPVAKRKQISPQERLQPNVSSTNSSSLCGMIWTLKLRPSSVLTGPPK